MAMNEFPILDEVKAILTERQQMYGRSEDSFQIIAEFWTTYLDRVCKIQTPISNKDVAIMMSLMKIAREMNQHKHDNMADVIGYIAHADRITRKEDEFQTAFNESMKEESEQPNDGGCSLADFDKAMSDRLDALVIAKKLSGFKDNDGGKGGAPMMDDICFIPSGEMFRAPRTTPMSYAEYTKHFDNLSKTTHPLSLLS